LEQLKQIWMHVDGLKLFYAVLTVAVVVVLVTAARAFGKLKPTRLGPDLNLLTYGFLWDTTLKAVQNKEYWPNFQAAQWPVNKATTLLVIALVNVVFTAWNMKLDESISAPGVTGFKLFMRRTLSLAVGITSLVMFLGISSILE
jgi:hypothetical protein